MSGGEPGKNEAKPALRSNIAKRTGMSGLRSVPPMKTRDESRLSRLRAELRHVESSWATLGSVNYETNHEARV